MCLCALPACEAWQWPAAARCLPQHVAAPSSTPAALGSSHCLQPRQCSVPACLHTKACHAPPPCSPTEMDGLEASRQIQERLPPEHRPVIVALSADTLQVSEGGRRGTRQWEWGTLVLCGCAASPPAGQHGSHAILVVANHWGDSCLSRRPVRQLNGPCACRRCTSGAARRA